MRAPDRSNLRVLVAEDYADIADAMAFVLEAHGHHVQVARDGVEAVRCAVDFQPDVILLDIGMPKLDGYAVAQQIRQQRGGDVVLIALTAWTRQEDQQRARAAGFDRHIAKPPDIPALMQILDEIRMLKQRAYPGCR